MDFSHFANLLIAVIYYVLVIIISLFSIFGVYILIRYGKSRMLTLACSLVYIIIFLTVLNFSYNLLNTIIS